VTDAQTFTGSCLCGGVRYRVNGPLRAIIACHCYQCQKTSGNYVAATSAPDDALVLESSETLRWFQSSPEAKRGFCMRCGGNMFWKPTGEARTSILAGTLDQATGLKVVKHIFVAAKADYTDIAPGVECRAVY
jgi:hypothetical protein